MNSRLSSLQHEDLSRAGAYNSRQLEKHLQLGRLKQLEDEFEMVGIGMQGVTEAEGCLEEEGPWRRRLGLFGGGLFQSGEQRRRGGGAAHAAAEEEVRSSPASAA